ncbi:MAG: hypothetical protein KF727_14460 [Microbacteriaceae bacterium]|nr:hypothetical protein [Microbacteriaceae bacterium]
MSDADGVVESAEAEMRTALMAAMQGAQVLMRMRQAAQERAARAEMAEAKRLQERFAAERQTAAAALAPVHQSSWWDQASTEDVAQMYETAVAWRDEDPAARSAQERINRELRDRYKVEINESSADPSVVRASLYEADRLGELSEQERAAAERDRAVARDHQLSADVLAMEAESADAGAVRLRGEADAFEDAAERSWDSAERRSEHAAQLQRSGESAAAAAWAQADVDQARHPREAIQGGKKTSPRARSKATEVSRQAERAGR